MAVCLRGSWWGSPVSSLCSNEDAAARCTRQRLQKLQWQQGQPRGHGVYGDNFPALFPATGLGQQLCSSWDCQQNPQVEQSPGPAHFPTASALSGLIFNYLKQKKEVAVRLLLTFSFQCNYSSKIKHSQEKNKGYLQRSSLSSFSSWLLMNKYESLLKMFSEVLSAHIMGLLKINRSSREVNTVKTVSLGTFLKIKSVPEISVNVFVEVGLGLRARKSRWLEPSVGET